MSGLAIVPVNREIVPAETRIVPANTNIATTRDNRPDKSLASSIGNTPSGANTLRKLAQQLEAAELPRTTTMNPGHALNCPRHSGMTRLRNALANFLEGFAGHAIKQLPTLSNSPIPGDPWDSKRLGGSIDVIPPKGPHDPLGLSFPANQKSKISRVHICNGKTFEILDTAREKDSGFIFSASPTEYPSDSVVVVEFSNKKNYHTRLSVTIDKANGQSAPQ